MAPLGGAGLSREVGFSPPFPSRILDAGMRRSPSFRPWPPFCSHRSARSPLAARASPSPIPRASKAPPGRAPNGRSSWVTPASAAFWRSPRACPRPMGASRRPSTSAPPACFRRTRSRSPSTSPPPDGLSSIGRRRPATNAPRRRPFSERRRGGGLAEGGGPRDSHLELDRDHGRLAALAAQNGLAVTSNFRIRFSQRDNSPVPIDGLQIDGVRIVVPPDGQSNSGAAPSTSTAAQRARTGRRGRVRGALLRLVRSGLAAGVLRPGASERPLPHRGRISQPAQRLVPGGRFAGRRPPRHREFERRRDRARRNGAGLLNSLAWTGPSGASVLTFTMPALPSGPWITFQAAMVNAPSITLTAAFQVSVP